MNVTIDENDHHTVSVREAVMDDNELEYEDIDDEYHEDDDDEYADEEEDSLSRLGSPRSSGSPFGGSSSSPFSSRSSRSPFSSSGSSPFGSRLGGGDKDEDEDDSDDKPSTPFSGRSSSSSFGSSGGAASYNPRSTGQFRRTGGSPIGGRRADEDEDDDEDEDSKSSSSSYRSRSSSNPFSSRPAGGSSSGSSFSSRSSSGNPFRSGSSSPTKDDDEKADDGGSSSSFRSRGSSPFSSRSSSGSSSSDPRRSTGQTSRTSGGSSDPRRSTGQTSRTSGGSSDPRRSTGQTSRTSGGSSSFGNRDSSRTSNLPGRSASSRFSSGGGSPSSPSSPDDKTADASKKEDAAADGDSKNKGRERLSNLRSNFGFGGGKKKDDKDQDAAPNKEKGADDTSGGIGGALSGIRNPFSFGGGSDKADADDSKNDKKDTPRSTRGSSKPAAKDDDDKDNGGGLIGSATGAIGGFTSRFGFGGKKTSDDTEAEVKPTQSKSSSPAFGSRGGSGVKPGSGRSPKTSTGTSRKADDKGKKDDKKDDGESKGIGGRFAAFTASLPFGGGADKKPASKTVRERSRTPKVEKGEGLSLDRKLDILGVGMVIVSLALLLSSLSQNQGVITESVNFFFASLLGWGAWAVPVAMMLTGGWLIVRHFGEEPPTLDMMRLIGVGVIYISLLVLFQFIHALNYTNVTSYQELVDLARLSWTEEMFIPSGGGWLGGNLYLLMVQYLGEILAFSVTLFGLIVGVMLLADVSMSEIAIIMIGLWRSFRAAQRRSSERKKVRRAERLAKRQEQLAALTPPEPSIEVSKPRAEQLTPGAGASPSAGSLPAPDGEQRAIPITMGGKTVNTSMTGDAVQTENAQASAQSSGGGLLSGIGAVLPFGGGDSSEKPAPAASKPAESGSSSPFGGLMNRLPFGGSSTPAPPPSQPNGGEMPPPQSAQISSTPPAPPSMPPPDAAPQAASSAPEAPPSATSPNGEGQNGDKKSTSELLHNKRISQVMEKVNGDTAGDETDEQATPEQNNGGADRLSRLDEIRQGRGGHPNQKSTNGGAQPTASKPEDALTAQSTPHTDDKPNNGSGAPTFVAGKTDAYGNPPTPPPSMLRPDEAKPEPVKAQVMADGFQRPSKRDWKLPNISELLSEGSEQDFDRQFLVEQARTIEDTLKSFGAPGRVVEINTGPVITQYGVEPDYLQSRSGKRSRVKVSAIAQLDRDLQLALGARSIRVEAPVPGKGYVGIEIPNAENALVSLKDVMEADQFAKIQKKSSLAIALGQSVDGTPVAADLGSMPHLLIAGTTGSGKSVCINSIISSLLANNTPEKLKLIMVDPKRVELTGYNGIPHLISPVVVELERIVGVLKWVTREMDERYKRFSGAGARHIEDFNKHLPPNDEPMPYIVVIIDELADLMMLAPEETERTITRIAALARATGIHLVIATQRPSVDVVTGLIKANFPARIAFAVAGSVDSRVILDQPGAERLLGRGDMLYLSGESPAPQRLQGVFVSDDEIDNITRYWRAQSAGIKPAPVKGMAPLSLDPASAPPQVAPATMPGASPLGSASQPALPMQQAFWDSDSGGGSGTNGDDPDDELYEEAVEMVKRLNKASVSLLQRRLRIGYTRASRLIDLMEERGVVGPQESGSKPREVLTN